MITSEALYDREQPFEQRLAMLVAWIEERLERSAGKDEQRVLAHLLATDAIAIPLHMIFPDEIAMDVTILHPAREAEDAPATLDDGEIGAFIWRHTGLDRETIERLQACDLKYEAIIGVVDWDAAFESEAAYQQALEHYEIVARKGTDGKPVHEDDAFWYVAARDFGIGRDDAEAYNRFKFIYLFATGIATDDVGTRQLA